MGGTQQSHLPCFFICKGRCVLVHSSKQQNSMSVSASVPMQCINIRWASSVSSATIFTIPGSFSTFISKQYQSTYLQILLPNRPYQELDINLKRQWMCPEKLSLSLKIHHYNSHSDSLVQSNRDNQHTNVALVADSRIHQPSLTGRIATKKAMLQHNAMEGHISSICGDGSRQQNPRLFR